MSCKDQTSRKGEAANHQIGARVSERKITIYILFCHGSWYIKLDDIIHPNHVHSVHTTTLKYTHTSDLNRIYKYLCVQSRKSCQTETVQFISSIAHHHHNHRSRFLCNRIPRIDTQRTNWKLCKLQRWIIVFLLSIQLQWIRLFNCQIHMLISFNSNIQTVAYATHENVIILFHLFSKDLWTIFQRALSHQELFGQFDEAEMRPANLHCVVLVHIHWWIFDVVFNHPPITHKCASAWELLTSTVFCCWRFHFLFLCHFSWFVQTIIQMHCKQFDMQNKQFA